MISNDDGKTILGKVDHGEAKWDHVHNKLIKLNSPEEEIVSPLHLLYSEEGKVLFTNNNNMGELPFTRKYLYEFNDENLFSANVSFFIPSVKSEHLKHFHTMQLLNDGKSKITNLTDDLLAELSSKYISYINRARPRYFIYIYY